MVDINEILHDVQQWQLIDVRARGEYLSGHIPGAANIPLFTDEERARVGTLYKQVNPEAAMKEGLKIAGHKLPLLLEAIHPYAKNQNKTLAIHCWRGGKRSEAVQWLVNFSGIPAKRLKGGYKSYRNAIHSYFADNAFDLRILGGYTGAGKTEILKALHRQGQQVIDLEKIAHHKGSAFGSIGEEKQPTNEQFENNLHSAFSLLDLNKPIWIENESRNIGRVYLPESIWTKMRDSTLYNINVSRDVRLQRALNYYAENTNTDELKASFDKIKKRLGGLDYQEALIALERGDLQTAASIALHYYDKSYTYQLQHWKPERVVQVDFGDEVNSIAKALNES